MSTDSEYRKKKTMIDSPELDKQQKIIESGKAETVEEFIDWLHGQGIELAYWETVESYRDPRLLPDLRRPEQIMADFFGIDLNRIKQEQEALLAELRAQAEGRSS